MVQSGDAMTRFVCFVFNAATESPCSPTHWRVFASKLLGDFAQHRVVVGRAVLRDCTPVHRFRREMGIATVSDHVAVPSFRIGVFLLHEGDAAKTILQRSHKVVVGQIAFQPHTLFAGHIEQENSRRPDRIEAVEPCRMLFDVGFYRKEVFADEFGSLLIFIRLGIQPSAGSSRRSRAEIEQGRKRVPVIVLAFHQAEPTGSLPIG